MVKTVIDQIQKPEVCMVIEKSHQKGGTRSYIIFSTKNKSE